MTLKRFLICVLSLVVIATFFNSCKKEVVTTPSKAEKVEKVEEVPTQEVIFVGALIWDSYNKPPLCRYFQLMAFRGFPSHIKLPGYSFHPPATF
jgi:hypothetical protein